MIYQHLNKRTKILPLATSHIAHSCNLFNHACTAKLRPRTPCLRRLEALPRDSQPPAGGDFAPRPPMVSRGWGLRPQTPKTASHCEFLATRLLTYANVKTWFEFDLQTKRLKGLGNLRISSRFLISAALVFPMAYKKRSKCDPNDVKVVVFFLNCENRPATGLFAPRRRP